MQHQPSPTTPEPWEGTPRAVINAQLPHIIQLYAETAMPWLLLKRKARTCFCLMGSKLTKKQIAFQFRQYSEGNPLPQNSIQKHPIPLVVWNAILEIDLLRWYKQTNPSARSYQQARPKLVKIPETVKTITEAETELP